MGPEKTCGHPLERMRQDVRGGKKRGWSCLDCRASKEREARADRVVTVKMASSSAPRPGSDAVAGSPPPAELAAGLCVDMDDVRFIQSPARLTDLDRHELNRACGNCPVRAICEDWTDRQAFFEGVAGGYTYAHQGSRRVKAPLMATRERVA